MGASMLQRWARRLQSLPLLVLMVMACGPRGPRRVVIGYAFPPSGLHVITAVRHELARHPIPGLDIQLVYDSLVPGDLADIEVARAERLAAVPGLVAIVGHGGSRGSLAAAPVYNDAGIPQIVPTGTSRLLRDVGRWTFMLAADDSVEGSLLGRFGAHRVTIFYVNDEYGTGLRDGALSELAGLGIAVVDEVPFAHRSDLKTLVEASVRRARPDAVIVAGRQDQTGTIARLMAERVPEVRILAGDGALQMPALADAAGPAADSVYAAAFWLPDQGDSLNREFIADYQAATGKLPLSADAMSRDAIMLVVQAIREVGPDRAAIRTWLQQLGRAHPPFTGVTGSITLEPSSTARLIVARLNRGEVQRVPFR